MKDYTKDRLFWKRLKSFVSKVEVNSYMDEDEKAMIISNCDIKIKELKLF